MNDENKISLEIVLKETDSPVAISPEREKLIETLKPLVPMIVTFSEAVKHQPVTNDREAKDMAEIIELISNQTKLVKETVKGFKAEADRRHGLWCDLEALFVEPFTAAYKIGKAKVISWQQAEAEKARKEQERLQAEENERCRREQERLLKLAAERKTPEVQERYKDEAAAIVPTQIRVAAPDKAVKTQSRWFVVSVDAEKFITAAAKDKILRGFLEVDTGKLQRAKAANSEFTADGIVFEKRAV